MSEKMKNKAKAVEKVLRQFWRTESLNGAYHACAIATNANQKGLQQEHRKMTVEEARDKIVKIFEEPNEFSEATIKKIRKREDARQRKMKEETKE